MKYKIRRITLVLIAILAIGICLQLQWNTVSVVTKPSSDPSIGNVKTLATAYERWKSQAILTGSNQLLTLPLSYIKGLSTEFTNGSGLATLDLFDGLLSIEVFGLPNTTTYDVWLIDKHTETRHDSKLNSSKGSLLIGHLSSSEKIASLQVKLNVNELPGFKLDQLAVSHVGKHPEQGGLLFGSPNLFQRLYYNEQRGVTVQLNANHELLDNNLPAPFYFLVPQPAYAEQSETVDLETLIAQGEDLFFNETFDGNGRTCGTCHPAENNFTIDPDFIATLPPDDPLFIAEFNEDLSNLENPTLLREFGLILANVDGFEDPTNKFVMRSVPHLLGLSVSIQSDRTVPPLNHMGWSGDGAPGSGRLRDFAIGAITQHTPKTLNRIPGKDFRLPTEDELDALEAFQLSLGRQTDFNIDALRLTDERAELGRTMFVTVDSQNGTVNAAKCIMCHMNAGALAATGINRNFNTGSENIVHPAKLTGELMPDDDGFGKEFNPKSIGDVSSRPTTIASVDWSPDNWDRGDTGVAQRTPNLKSIVQEIIDLPGWQLGNAMVFVASSNGTINHRTAENGINNGPILTIQTDNDIFVSDRAVAKLGNVAEEDITTSNSGLVETLNSASSDLELTSDSAENRLQVVGIRFPNINVPEGAIIVDSFIQFESDEDQSGPVSITIKGEASDNASLFRESTGGFGDSTFNTPPLWEAADTAPYYHNNFAATLEEAIAFYDSDEFRQSPEGQLILSTDTGGQEMVIDVDALASFLRVINVLENTRSAKDFMMRIKGTTTDTGIDKLTRLALADLEDALQVLADGNLHEDAVIHLENATRLITDIMVTFLSVVERNELLDQAISETNAARSLMVREDPLPIEAPQTSLDPTLTSTPTTTPTTTTPIATTTTLPAIDITPPTVVDIFPEDGSVVCGTVMISVDASDSSGIQNVDFEMDQQIIGQDSTPPFEHAWNTNVLFNGPKTLNVTVIDNAGNSNTVSRTFTVRNFIYSVCAGVKNVPTTPINITPTPTLTAMPTFSTTPTPTPSPSPTPHTTSTPPTGPPDPIIKPGNKSPEGEVKGIVLSKDSSLFTVTVQSKNSIITLRITSATVFKGSVSSDFKGIVVGHRIEAEFFPTVNEVVKLETDFPKGF